MKTALTTESAFIDDLRSIAAADGPCVTMLMPMEITLAGQHRRNQTSLKKCIRTARQALLERGVDSASSDHLLSGLETSVSEMNLQRDYPGVVILRSADVSRFFQVPERVPEQVRVGEHFFLKPLLRLRDEQREFFLLELSQKNLRLLRCTQSGAEEMSLPPGVPTSLEEAMQTKPPDHLLANRSTAGPSVGSMGGVTFGMGADREAKGAYLANFFSAVNRGVREVLRDARAPLVLAGVDYEVSIYRQVNTYPHLSDDAVYGAPSGMNNGLHRRALEIAQKEFDAPFNAALAEYEELDGTARTLTSAKEIVRAAHDGRVSTLFIDGGAELPGTFVEETQQVRSHREPEPGDEDLINLAAIHALLTRSEIFLTQHDQMPHGAQMAAVLRY